MNTNKIEVEVEGGIFLLKTFNYESNCIKYRNCYFEMGQYEKGKMSLAIYGYGRNDKEASYISNATVNVEEKLEENQIVIDNYSNTNLISFLLDLGIATKIVKRVVVKFIQLPVVEINLEKLKEYCYKKEEANMLASKGWIEETAKEIIYEFEDFLCNNDIICNESKESNVKLINESGEINERDYEMLKQKIIKQLKEFENYIYDTIYNAA